MLPDAQIPKLKVNGELPRLNVRVSNKKYKQLMALVEEIVPKSEANDEVKAVAVDGDEDTDSLMSRLSALEQKTEPAPLLSKPSVPTIAIADGDDDDDDDDDDEFHSADEGDESVSVSPDLTAVRS